MITYSVVATGQVLDRFDADANGVLTYETGVAEGLVTSHIQRMGQRDALEMLASWSNGYVQTKEADEEKAFLEQMAAKHLRDRHDQRTHGRHSAVNRAAQAAQELGELRESIARARSRQPRDDSDDSDSGFRWMSPDDAMAMRKQMLEGDPWTPQQKDALNRYVGDAYYRMNGLLRDDKEAVEDLSDGEIAEYTSLIRDANAGMRPTTAPVKVKRFVGGFASFGIDQDTMTREEIYDALRGMVGSTLQEPGLMSTSLDRNYGKEQWPGKILIELDVPAGAMGAYLDGDVGFAREQELTLTAGTPFLVTDVVIDPPRNTVRGRVIVS